MEINSYHCYEAPLVPFCITLTDSKLDKPTTIHAGIPSEPIRGLGKTCMEARFWGLQHEKDVRIHLGKTFQRERKWWIDCVSVEWVLTLMLWIIISWDEGTDWVKTHKECDMGTYSRMTRNWSKGEERGNMMKKVTLTPFFAVRRQGMQNRAVFSKKASETLGNTFWKEGTQRTEWLTTGGLMTKQVHKFSQAEKSIHWMPDKQNFKISDFVKMWTFEPSSNLELRACLGTVPVRICCDILPKYGVSVSIASSVAAN